MKSVTPPARIRSARFPSAPPVSNPTPSQNHGLVVSNANQPTTSDSETIVTASTSASLPSSSRPNAMPLLVTLARSIPSARSVRSPGTIVSMIAPFVA